MTTSENNKDCVLFFGRKPVFKIESHPKEVRISILDVKGEKKSIISIIPKKLLAETTKELMLKKLKKVQPKIHDAVKTQLDAKFISHDDELDKIISNASISIEETKEEESVEEESFDEATIKEAERILKEGNPVQAIMETLSDVHVGDEYLKVGQCYSVGTAYIETEQLHKHIIGPSSTGKGLANKFSQLLPIDKVMIFDTVSPKFLAYELNGKNVDGVVIIILEADNTTTNFMRGLLSSNCFGQKHQKSGTVVDYKAVKLGVIGDPVAWLTSVSIPKDEDNQLPNRFSICHTDASREQDLKVLGFQIEALAEGNERKLLNESKAKVCRCIFSILAKEKDKVKIPALKKLKESFLKRWPAADNRRMFPQFVSHIKGRAKLFKFQRHRSEDGAIVAEFEDIENTMVIWTKFMPVDSHKITPRAIAISELLVRHLKEVSAGEQTVLGLTAKEIADKLKFTVNVAYGAIHELENLNCISFQYEYPVGGGKAKRYISSDTIESSVELWDEQTLATLFTDYSAFSHFKEEEEKTKLDIYRAENDREFSGFYYSKNEYKEKNLADETTNKVNFPKNTAKSDKSEKPMPESNSSEAKPLFSDGNMAEKSEKKRDMNIEATEVQEGTIETPIEHPIVKADRLRKIQEGNDPDDPWRAAGGQDFRWGDSATLTPNIKKKK